MKTCIFVGPTLPESEVREILPDALILGPAEQGDIDFARRQLGADVIGLIDGVHTLQLPVWHKEILSVLADGARFLGAASLGALRAVECELYGAEAIGEIADMYRTGVLVNDDAVCLAHADKAHGYRALSVPFVNIMATLRACGTERNEGKHYEILEYANQLYYPDRNWQTIFDGCELDDELRKVILAYELDLKAADALHLCYYIADNRPRPKPEREIKHAHDGYGHVFDHNDRKLMVGNRIVRKCDIAQAASNYDRMNARNRALAIELCEHLGITPREPHNDAFWNQERALSRAGEWLSSRVYGNADVPAITDFLWISGRYKEGAI